MLESLPAAIPYNGFLPFPTRDVVFPPTRAVGAWKAPAAEAPPMDTDPTEIDRLIRKLSNGDPRAADELIPLIYTELHRIAETAMRRQPRSHTLQPTALVNELYLKLFPTWDARLNDREHFLVLVARAMEQILIDRARGKQTEKRRPKGERVLFEDLVEAYEHNAHGLLELHEALERFAKVDPRSAEVVRLRFFAGRAPAEVARVLGVSRRTELRMYEAARVWLRKELQ